MVTPGARQNGGERRSSRQPPAALTKQRSFESERPPQGTGGSSGSGGGGMPLERARDLPLSRSYSFMQRRDKPADDDAMHERFLLGGLRSVESTPQPRRRWETPSQSAGSRDASAGVDSLCTPLMNRKPGGRPRFQLDVLRSAGGESDSSGSPPSPQRPLFSPGRRAGRTSADSSPHSQFDSGVVSTSTTAGSQRSAARDGGRPAVIEEPKPVIVHGVTARAEETPPRSGAADYFFDPATQANLIPLHQYILEQAKLSGGWGYEKCSEITTRPAVISCEGDSFTYLNA